MVMLLFLCCCSVSQWLATECDSLGPNWQVFLISSVTGLPVTEAELEAKGENGTEKSKFASLCHKDWERKEGWPGAFCSMSICWLAASGARCISVVQMQNTKKRCSHGPAV